MVAYRSTAPFDAFDVSETTALRKEAETLHRAAAALSARVRAEYPDYDRLMSGRPLATSELAALLAPGERVWYLRVTENRPYAWSLSDSTAPRMIGVEITAAEISAQVGRLRHALDPQGVRYLSDIPPFPVNVARELYRRLVAPLADDWQEGEPILVVADGALQPVLRIFPLPILAPFPGGRRGTR